MEDFEKIIDETENTDSIVEKTVEDTTSAENTEIAGEAENTVEEITDTENGVVDFNTTTDEDNLETDSNEEAPKKKIVQTPVIIAACILIVAIIAGGAYYLFFNNSIVGTWVIDKNANTTTKPSSSTEKTSERYFTFNSDGKAYLSVGTTEIEGTWEYTTEPSSQASAASADEKNKDKKYIQLNLMPLVMGSFEVNVEGNIFTGKTLTLTTQNSPIKFKSVAKVVPELKVSKNFKPNKDITGSWKYKDTMATYTYKFNSDGTFSFNQNGQNGKSTTTGVYTVDAKKKTINETFIGDIKNDTKLPYETGKKGKELILSKVKFTKQK